MSPQRRLTQIKHLRWTLVFFGIGLLATMGVYLRVTDQQKNDRSEARVTAAVARLTAVRHNSIVCVTRPYLKKSVERARASEHDLKQTDSQRARARAARISAEVFLNGLLTVPPNYDCTNLLRQLRAKAQHGGS